MSSHRCQLLGVGCQIVSNVSFLRLRKENQPRRNRASIEFLRIATAIAGDNQLVVMILEYKGVDESKQCLQNFLEHDLPSYKCRIDGFPLETNPGINIEIKDDR